MVWYDPECIPGRLNMVTREEWGATPPLEEAEYGPLQPLKTPVSRVCFNCTGSKTCYTNEECTKLLQQVQENYKDCGYADITHNFMVGADGRVYEGRGWNTKPDGIYGKHQKSTMDIAFIGWYMDFNPLPKQVETAEKLIEHGIKAKKIKEDYLQTWFRD